MVHVPCPMSMSFLSSEQKTKKPFIYQTLNLPHEHKNLIRFFYIFIFVFFTICSNAPNRNTINPTQINALVIDVTLVPWDNRNKHWVNTVMGKLLFNSYTEAWFVNASVAAWTNYISGQVDGEDRPAGTQILTIQWDSLCFVTGSPFEQPPKLNKEPLWLQKLGLDQVE